MILWRASPLSLWIVMIVLYMISSIPSQAGGVGWMERQASPKITATWLWDTKQIASQPEQILQFAEQRGVNLIYLQIDRSLADSAYREFISAASRLGIAVHALDGHPDWALPAGRANMTGFVDWVQRYNRFAGEAEKFQGIHLDVEPYLLPEWSSERDKLVGYWMETVTAFQAKASQDPALATGADLPFWMNEIQVADAAHGDAGSKLSDWMIERFDQVTLMSYRDRAIGPRGIEPIVKDELASADRLGKRIIVGVETNPSTEGSFVTFYGKGLREMESQLRILVLTLRDHDSFAGYAVHDYAGWRKLAGNA